MLTLGVNTNNDLNLNDTGNMTTKTGIESVLQNCQTAVQMTLNEAIFKQGEGVPAFQTIWNGNPNFQQAESSLRDIILKVDGVVNINYFTYSVNQNIFSYNVEIQTIYGLTELQGALNV